MLYISQDFQCSVSSFSGIVPSSLRIFVILLMPMILENFLIQTYLSLKCTNYKIWAPFETIKGRREKYSPCLLPQNFFLKGTQKPTLLLSTHLLVNTLLSKYSRISLVSSRVIRFKQPSKALWLSTLSTQCVSTLLSITIQTK